jgi:hypothetical protein
MGWIAKYAEKSLPGWYFFDGMDKFRGVIILWLLSLLQGVACPEDKRVLTSSNQESPGKMSNVFPASEKRRVPKTKETTIH